MAATAILIAVGFSTARTALVAAEGNVSFRGGYYKERSTRVVQPMLDIEAVTASGSEFRAHGLVDAITSASIASGATDGAFTEKRYEVGADYLHAFGRVALGFGGRFSSEPDYTSTLGRVRARIELAEQNTILDTTAGVGFDEVSNAGAQGGLSSLFTDELRTLLGSLSISQVLSPTSTIKLTYDIANLSGYQANPYRNVTAGGVLVPERVPRMRTRHAAQVSTRFFAPSTNTTGIFAYRFYADDWGVLGHTPTLRILQDVSESLSVSARYRLHYQSRADFYQHIYNDSDPQANPFVTADQKLARATTHVFGIKLTSALSPFGFPPRWQDAQIELIAEYVRQSTAFGNAVVAQTAFVFPF